MPGGLFVGLQKGLKFFLAEDFVCHKFSIIEKTIVCTRTGGILCLFQGLQLMQPDSFSVQLSYLLNQRYIFCSMGTLAGLIKNHALLLRLSLFGTVFEAGKGSVFPEGKIEQLIRGTGGIRCPESFVFQVFGI